MARELILEAETEVGDGLVTGSLQYDSEWYTGIVDVIFNDCTTHRETWAGQFEESARSRFMTAMTMAEHRARDTARAIQRAVDAAARTARIEGRVEAEMGAA